jgi:hypothetical protein
MNETIKVAMANPKKIVIGKEQAMATAKMKTEVTGFSLA